jgi:GTP-binding protein EngB required for normal cell division
LAQIQQIISKPYVLQPQVNIQLDPIFKSWLAEGGEVKEESIKWSLTSNSIVEIIGRSNGGKSYLLNEMII